MDNLSEFIASLEAGTFYMDVLPPHHEITAHNAFNGSLDAAATLLEALLPGWRKCLNFMEFADGSVSVTVFGPLPKTANKWEFSPIYEGLSTTPARALLLATLRAYRSTREDE